MISRACDAILDAVRAFLHALATGLAWVCGTVAAAGIVVAALTLPTLPAVQP